jgi:hypothetical protein
MDFNLVVNRIRMVVSDTDNNVVIESDPQATPIPRIRICLRTNPPNHDCAVGLGFTTFRDPNVGQTTL